MKGMKDFTRRSLLSIILKSFQLSGIKETHNCTAFAKYGDLKVLKLHASGGIFHSSPVLIADPVKIGIIVHGLYI